MFVSAQRLRQLLLISLVALSCAAGPASAAGEAAAQRYTYLGPGLENGYLRRLLFLALDATKAEYGDFRVDYTRPMSEARAHKIMQGNKYPHPLRVFETRQWVLDDAATRPIPFPVFLDTYGYRVCFGNRQRMRGFARARRLDEIAAYSFGLGTGWRDNEILRANKLKVIDAGSIEGLYKMAAAGRVDLFCRAAVELPIEVDIYTQTQDLVLDSSKALHYSMPFFFYTKAEDTALAERLTLGLQRSYASGAVLTLWKEFFHQALQDAKMDQRLILELRNPVTESIPFPYQQYAYHPQR